MEAVGDPVAEAAFAGLDAALDTLISSSVGPAEAREAARWIRRCERVRRRLDAVQASLVSAIDDGRLHGEDGHYSPTAMIEHHGGLSRGEAAARARTARTLSALPVVDQRYATERLVDAELAAILDAYTRAEYETDRDKARADHGDDATGAHLPRTAAQRRADALVAIFHHAATPTTTSASVPVHNIIWSADTYTTLLHTLETGDTAHLDVDTHRCSTLDGIPVDPTEAVIASLSSRLRRVVIDAKAVTIDLGQARFFTGSARHAVTVTNPTCMWPGCHTPTTNCQIDHLREHHHRGRTHPGNGAPLCGRHNRHKHNHRHRIQRDPTGTHTITRPNGTRLE